MTRALAIAVTILNLLAPGAAAHDAPAGSARLVLVDVDQRSTPEPGVVEIALRPESYTMLWERGRAVVADFPLPGGQLVDLDLRPFRVLAPGATVIDVGPDGVERELAPRIRFVRGTVVDDIDSSVVLGLFQNRISGVIKTRDESFGVGPREASLDAPGATALIVRDRALEEGDWSCDANEHAALAASSIDLDAIRRQADELRQAGGSGVQLRLDIAVDSTTEWCAHFGNDAVAAQNYLLSAMAQVSAIYDAEVLELFEVVFLRTFCGGADPYTDGLGLADRQQLLDELATEWTTNQTGVARTVAHLFSKSDSASAGGLAQTVICSGTCTAVLCNDDYGYGVTLFPASGGSPAGFEVSVAAHEFGHNHSSPHTNCLQDGAGDWLTTCTIESCGLNPWCQATGCFPGPEDDAVVGTIMSTGCNSRQQVIDDTIVETIMRSSAEAASCIGSAGSPGAVREQSGDGLRLALPTSCPSETFANDDGSADSATGGSGTALLSWIERYTPGCYPFRLTEVGTLIWNSDTVAVGRPIRLLVYADESASGDPANSTLVYTEDVTVQTISFSEFNEYTLATPVTIPGGDVYIGFYDLVDDVDTNFIASIDTSTSGDSWFGFSTSPTGFSPRNGESFMVRGAGGPIAVGSVELSWGLPCNDTTVPNQDFGVYRGDIGAFTSYDSLTCSTGGSTAYVAVGAPDDSFFLVVPQTTPFEGSYGVTDAGAGGERPSATVACKPQSVGACP